MQVYDIILQNREIFKLIFTLLIGFICFIIVLRTNKLFKLSSHQGIRYFRNAFFFYGLAFILRYLLGLFSLELAPKIYSHIIESVFDFFLIMAGFFLVYSLFWKKFEGEKASYSSLFNLKIFIFYMLALIMVILDQIWNTYLFMFILQIILFTSASIISCVKYLKTKQKTFLSLYFLVIVLNLVAWVANFLVAIIFRWNINGVIITYILNIIIFLLFLYCVLKVTSKNL